MQLVFSLVLFLFITTFTKALTYGTKNTLEVGSEFVYFSSRYTAVIYDVIAGSRYYSINMNFPINYFLQENFFIGLLLGIERRINGGSLWYIKPGAQIGYLFGSSRFSIVFAGFLQVALSDYILYGGTVVAKVAFGQILINGGIRISHYGTYSRGISSRLSSEYFNIFYARTGVEPIIGVSYFY